MKSRTNKCRQSVPITTITITVNCHTENTEEFHYQSNSIKVTIKENQLSK